MCIGWGLLFLKILTHLITILHLCSLYIATVQSAVSCGAAPCCRVLTAPFTISSIYSGRVAPGIE